MLIGATFTAYFSYSAQQFLTQFSQRTALFLLSDTANLGVVQPFSKMLLCLAAINVSTLHSN